MRHFYRPKHAAPYNAQTARAATTLAEVYQPRHAAPEQPEYQPRRITCSGCGGTGRVAWYPGQIRNDDTDDQPCPDCTALVPVAYTGHGLSHGARPSFEQGQQTIRLMPLTGPQSPGRAW